MITNKNIQSMIFGVLFKPSFKVLDYWGSIADDISYDNKYFPEDFFPEITMAYTNERALINHKTNDSLKLTQNNLILTQSVQKDYNSEYKSFYERVTSYLVPEIISKYNLIVQRIGMVYICNLDPDEIKKFTSIYFKDEFKGISDFRFSKKESAEAGSVWLEKSDYINKIFTIGNINQELKGLSYDFQYYFYPPQSDIRDKVNNFLSQSNNNFEKDIIKSINRG